MLPTGKITKVVSSATVEQVWTTVFWLSDTFKTAIGLFKTLGPPLGEKRVLLILSGVTLAVFARKLNIPLFEDII